LCSSWSETSWTLQTWLRGEIAASGSPLRLFND
jgi:hypothetical protein